MKGNIKKTSTRWRGLCAKIKNIWINMEFKSMRWMI
ncbi:hypothetical protein CLOBOL_01812 [Enterocloster bolteae ATCC BAA-613]|uniref:Uncharacterized protein n=1 Tax=Enterocloster bolteae (strain ATCC BAA-613 / DSM 15670 / CCUG 46953 / JCM 12243 / WAL 16351) TaxID=411902 RepID=A8RM39_ENTBW|nr:hypothetical protein CLOBOL_01812 [Enterocloster bolteae ATCC BAA-613]